MKSYITAFMLICFASFSSSQTNYEKDWNQVEKLENDGLTKSAAELVNKIYTKAKTEKNTQQLVKSLLFQSKYLQVLEEDSQLKIVNNFKVDIDASDIVTKHLLENILANLYWQHYKQNRWKFYERSKTAAKVDSDFRTWDLDTLFNEIHNYFQCSLEDAETLQNQDLKDYSQILFEVEGSKEYRPTLYDLLSHNALDFYKTPENNITKPSYKFTIDSYDYIETSGVFSKLNMTSKDSTNLQLNALKIYQNLIRFHQNDKSSNAFVTVNIERLNFVKQHATFGNVDDAFIKTLQIEDKDTNGKSSSALYNYELANLLSQKGSKYSAKKPETDAYRWQFKDALQICESVIKKHPKSSGAKKCETLKARIIKPDLGLITEKHVPLNSESLILVNYKNLDALTFNIYKVSFNQLKKYNSTYRADDREKFIKKLNVHKTFSSTLINEKDYQVHSLEVVLPALDNGLYLVVAKTETDVFSTADIQVTDMALIETQETSSISYQLVNRNNGKPISGASVKLHYRSNRNVQKEFSSNFTTDSQGQFTFNKNSNNYYSVYATVKHGNETAIFGESYINRLYNRNEKNTIDYRTFIITDRSIYRPGQTVYFKGIATQTQDTKSKVVPNYEVSCALHDVNGQKISESKYFTNEYGSFDGEFILPNGGLTGNFTIHTYSTTLGNSTKTISVEEYKRPKFETNFDPITESYKINDSITVHGKAIAFAGSNITDAKVVYRVKRQVQFPNWYYWRGSFNSEAQEITFGESLTDSDGKFEITFKALPDDSASNENLPIFTYEVTADVTDLNGETRSATTTVNVGHHALLATVNVPQRLDKSLRDNEIAVSTTNLNNEFVPAKGTLKIYKLSAPNEVLRPRPWEAPDYKLLTKEAFKSQFPNWAYNNESDFRNWQNGDLVFETDFDTEASKTIALKRMTRWESGKYRIELESEDKFGQAVKDKSFFDVYSNTDKAVADQSFFDISLDKDEYHPNENAKLTFGTASTDATATLSIEKEGKIIDTQVHALDDNTTSVELPITNKDLGGFVVHFSFVTLNSIQTSSVFVNVPYPSTDLQIETSTFRDKLQPGQDETWSFKVKGPKGDKVAAEVLASMYDASLDEFKSGDWSFNPIYRSNYRQRSNTNTSKSFGTVNFRRFNNFKRVPYYAHQKFDRLDWFGLYFGNRIMLRGVASNAKSMSMPEEDATLDEVVVVELAEVESVNDDGRLNSQNSEKEYINALENSEGNGLKIKVGKYAPGVESTINQKIQIRKNLNETAFFFPQLSTDEAGNVSFNFKAPEALTQWKLQLLAHTKTLESSVAQFEAVTQKELMVIPNAPRFLREGDEIVISTKIANLSDKNLNGIAKLELTDAVTGNRISEEIINSELDQEFDLSAKGNTNVNWTLNIPENIQAIQYTVTAQSEDFSDGEQSVLPVLSNRMLVTETLPMWVKSDETRTFTLDKLANTTSPTLKHHKLTLEVTSNPAWYAVQALPYLMEYPYDCNEQTFSRYYANALAQHISKSNPKIEAVFNQWKSKDALISNLEKNEDLKSLLIQETPWLRDAQSETEQKKRIALLFDLNKMNNELQSALRKLRNNQHDTGAWPWFNGGYDNRYITQHIIGGFGHLKKLGVTLSPSTALRTGSDEESQMIEKAINYLDKQFIKEYKDLKRYGDVDLSKDHLSHMQLHYLYVRSFFPEFGKTKALSKIEDYYRGQIKTYWLKRPLYAKGLMALIMHRNKDSTTANKILKSLKENSITSEELGMYWKENTASWYWHQAPIETQALIIEAFSEIENDIEAVDNLKIWLLKNKQTNKWSTTKATADAVYALLLQGSDWLSVTDAVEVTVGNQKIDPNSLDNVSVEAGTGYFKTSWNANAVSAEQSKVTMSKKGDGIAWGALYWQYFEDLDKITSAETPLNLKKKLFLKQNTDRGEEISEITENTKLNLGDLVRVRIELRSDRNMEFLHLKDMRASGFEPVNVISRYKWQDGLGYYESTKDAATNFFIDYLPKGVYVFEYDLRVNNAGDMSNGITTIQSMYAPEFSSHSEGVRVKVE